MDFLHYFLIGALWGAYVWGFMLPPRIEKTNPRLEFFVMAGLGGLAGGFILRGLVLLLLPA